MIAYGPHDSRVSLHVAGTGAKPNAKPVWTRDPLNRTAAVAVTPNAIVVTGHRDAAESGAAPQPRVMALRLEDGEPLWSAELPGLPAAWGLLVDRAGRVVVALEDGRVLAWGGE